MNALVKKYFLHAINVWNVFKMNTMCDYHNLYFENRCFVIIMLMFLESSLAHV